METMSWLKRLLGIEYGSGGELRNDYSINLKEAIEMSEDVRSLANNLNQLTTLLDAMNRLAKGRTSAELNNNPAFQTVFKNFGHTLFQIRKQILFALSLEEVMRKIEQKAETAKTAAGRRNDVDSREPQPYSVNEWGEAIPNIPPR